MPGPGRIGDLNASDSGKVRLLGRLVEEDVPAGPTASEALKLTT